jgi:mannose-6-phosphate isomerase
MIRELVPVYKDYLWGGTKLKHQYRAECDYAIVAEAWVCANHRDGVSTIKGTEDFLSGLSNNGLGRHIDLPVLVKFLDAKQDLSVQVHPDDVMAMALENDLGKNEVWYILDHEPGAAIYFGLNQSTTAQEFKSAVEQGVCLDLLQRVEVKVGDVFYVQAGTIHALGAGITALEVQQSSNATYRLYDFQRRDSNGNLRPLHLDKGIQAIDFTKINPTATQPLVLGNGHEQLISNQYFTVDHYVITSETNVPVTAKSFHNLVGIKGEVIIRQHDQVLTVLPGTSLLIEAGDSQYTLSGQGEVIITQCQ